jgi:hypothetical protein
VTSVLLKYLKGRGLSEDLVVAGKIIYNGSWGKRLRRCGRDKWWALVNTVLNRGVP